MMNLFSPDFTENTPQIEQAAEKTSSPAFQNKSGRQHWELPRSWKNKLNIHLVKLQILNHKMLGKQKVEAQIWRLTWPWGIWTKGRFIAQMSIGVEDKQGMFWQEDVSTSNLIVNVETVCEMPWIPGENLNSELRTVGRVSKLRKK